MNTKEKIEFLKNAHVGDLVTIGYNTKNGAAGLHAFIGNLSTEEVKVIGKDPYGLIQSTRGLIPELILFEPRDVTLESIRFYSIHNREEYAKTGKVVEKFTRVSLHTTEYKV